MNNKVYITCPPRYTTGGIELLHQLCAELNKNSNINAKILYIDQTPEKGNPQPELYNKYRNQYIINQIPEADYDKNITIIFPEIYINNIHFYDLEKCNIVIYWESVDNYFMRGTKDQLLQLPSSIIHLAQSAYAENFLKNIMGFKNVMKVGDYLNDDFFSITKQKKKEKIPYTVCYNPAKGLNFTKRIIAATPGVKFIELKGLNRPDLIDTLSSSMLYIDFGSHPGKDRLPREAAMCGCCILVGAIGSAIYEEDMFIPRQYKMDFKIDRISKAIYRILNNYDACIRDFYNYCNKIKQEKENFQREVKEFAEVIIK